MRLLSDIVSSRRGRFYNIGTIYDFENHFQDKFSIDGLLKPNGVKPVVLPPRNPNLHAHCERFVRSLKAESLDQMLMPDERSLSYVLQQYLVHYHAERNHRGLDKQLIALDADLRSHSSQARRRDRLGGLLCYYYRAVA